MASRAVRKQLGEPSVQRRRGAKLASVQPYLVRVSCIFHNSQQLSCKIFQDISHSSKMQAEERHQRIEKYLQRVEFASLEELAKHVGASVSTVRRDLTTLDAAKTLKRTHGG